MDKENIIKIIESYAAFLKENNYSFKKIFLFGSYAKGNYNDDSDIDVAVILDNLNDTQDELIKLMKYRREIDERIEPHPFNIKDFDESNPFVSEIIKTGIEIK